MRTLFIITLYFSLYQSQLWYYVNGIYGNDNIGMPGSYSIPFRTIQGAINLAIQFGRTNIDIYLVQGPVGNSYIFESFDIRGLDVNMVGSGIAISMPIIDSNPMLSNKVKILGATIYSQPGQPVLIGVPKLVTEYCVWVSNLTRIRIDNAEFTSMFDTYYWTGPSGTLFTISSSSVDIYDANIVIPNESVSDISEVITVFDISNSDVSTDNVIMNTKNITRDVDMIITDATFSEVKHYNMELVHSKQNHVNQIVWATGTDAIIDFYGVKALGSNNTREILNVMTGKSLVNVYDFYTDNTMIINHDSSLGSYNVIEPNGINVNAGLEFNARTIYLCGDSIIELTDQFLILKVCNISETIPELILPNFSGTSNGKRIDVKNTSGRGITLIGGKNTISSPSFVLYFVKGVWLIL